MEKDWVVIYTTDQLYKSEILKDVFEDHQINCVVMNKQDSSYMSFGSINVLVQADDVIKAKHIINKIDF